MPYAIAYLVTVCRGCTHAKKAAQSKLTESQIWSMALIFDAYLGTVMLKNSLSEKSYHWGKDGTSHIPLLVADTGRYIAPIGKVCKRLVNGAEDNV